ncbi:hypothetical protein [uncultured Parasphingopyxis sp.]|uniref:hypothetical protein n=1 Tax=uncultured Parasphingopyxis sp. TaxID=1547918 RepID=UPI00262B0B74|nr:hypothetical protein [uncultured Parasphingopyxis sp.]
MEPPPSRYSVIEKDRRLFVFDRGEPVMTLVHHAHPGETPGKRRERAKAERKARTNAPGLPQARAAAKRPERRSKPATSTNGPASNKAAGRLIGSIAAFSVLIFLFWPLLLPLLFIGAVALGVLQNQGQSAHKRVLGAWWRWVSAE